MNESETTILAVARHRGQYHWFRSEPSYWILDAHRWRAAFREAGYDDDLDNGSHRFGLAVVDEQTASKFIAEMAVYSVPVDVLSDEFLVVNELAEEWFDLAEYLPAVFVDFDSKKLWSVHGEPPSLEDHVPRGWHGVVASFFDELPSKEAYWTVDGLNTLRRFF